MITARNATLITQKNKTKSTMTFKLISPLASLFILAIPCSTYGYEQALDLGLEDRYLREYIHNEPSYPTYLKSINVDGESRSYYWYKPATVNHKRIPMLIALHGAGRTGASMLEAWMPLSEIYGFAVIAPNGKDKNWNLEPEDSNFILKATQDMFLREKNSADNTYLFGHSNGGKLAIMLAAEHPELFAGICSHAGTLPTEVKINRKTLVSTQKKIPIGIFLGDRDHIFSIASARATTTWLSSYNFYPSLYVLTNHTHWYYHDSRKINLAVWDFFQGKAPSAH